MNGKRINDYAERDPFLACYWKQDGIWFICLPGDIVGNLARHVVTEHEDGTITATPSILIRTGNRTDVHGYLTRGVWSDC